MILLARPTDGQIRNTLAAQAPRPLSYPELGMTRSEPPRGYAVDRNRAELGKGAAVFERARSALLGWRFAPAGWMELRGTSAPPAEGAVIGIIAHLPGVWSLNACRVVYVSEEEDGPQRRVGFAWGTLPAHIASGEERFRITWDRATDAVWYDILAFSRPRHPLVKLGYPVMRLFQKRFARDSKAAMVRAAV